MCIKQNVYKTKCVQKIKTTSSICMQVMVVIGGDGGSDGGEEEGRTIKLAKKPEKANKSPFI